MAGVGEVWANGWRVAFNGTRAHAILGGWASVLYDKTETWAREALQQRFPQLSTAEALALMADERSIVPGPTETQLSLAERVALAVVQWRFGATPCGMLAALAFAEFPGAVIVQQNGMAFSAASAPTVASMGAFWDDYAAPSWLQVDTLGPNPYIPASGDGKAAIAAGTVPWWSFPGGPMDGNGNQWCSRFGIVFPAGTSPGLGTATNLARIRRVIALWKPGKATCAGIWVCSGGSYWGAPGLVWGGFNWGGTVTYYAGA